LQRLFGYSKRANAEKYASILAQHLPTHGPSTSANLDYHVIIDAMGCGKTIASKIIERGGGSYVC
jgi:hypothetical protein